MYYYGKPLQDTAGACEASLHYFTVVLQRLSCLLIQHINTIMTGTQSFFAKEGERAYIQGWAYFQEIMVLYKCYAVHLLVHAPTVYA